MKDLYQCAECGFFSTCPSDFVFRNGELICIDHITQKSEIKAISASFNCPNDTNGDGDCHLCHNKGGCFVIYKDTEEDEVKP